jgi:hypothetical protein
MRAHLNGARPGEYYIQGAVPGVPLSSREHQASQPEKTDVRAHVRTVVHACSRCFNSIPWRMVMDMYVSTIIRPLLPPVDTYVPSPSELACWLADRFTDTPIRDACTSPIHYLCAWVRGSRHTYRGLKKASWHLHFSIRMVQNNPKKLGYMTFGRTS